MHIQIDGDTVGRYDLHWRGVALADFDGQPGRIRASVPFATATGRQLSVPRSRTQPCGRTRASKLARKQVIHYRVLMEPIGTNVFFLAPWARSVSGDYRLLAADSGGAVYDFDSRHPSAAMRPTPTSRRPSPAELRTAGRIIPADCSDVLRLPALDPRVPQLAAQITESASNDFDKAAAIENYLQTRFGYTLQLAATAEDPIAISFRAQTGTLRVFRFLDGGDAATLGIPSRVVNGFRSDEFNDLPGATWSGPKTRMRGLRRTFRDTDGRRSIPLRREMRERRRAGAALRSTSMPCPHSGAIGW